MKLMVGIIIFVVALTGRALGGQFTGTFELGPEGCMQTGKCILAQDFGFTDDAGIGWEAKKGLATDGASIPPWAQPFIGGSFDREFVQAAIIHDHYCNRHVRTWRATHRVFYDALLASGVDKDKAMIMYYAVYLGGPKWTKLVQGIPCQVGKMCIRRAPNQMWPGGAQEQTAEDGQRYIVRKAEYASPLFVQQLSDANRFIAERGTGITLTDLEQLAESVRPGDFYYAVHEVIAVHDSGSPGKP